MAGFHSCIERIQGGELNEEQENIFAQLLIACCDCTVVV